MTMGYDNACPPAQPWGQQLERCGYLRSPCRVWIGGNNNTIGAAASAEVEINAQDPFAGDLVQMHATDAAGAATAGVNITTITVGTRPQQVNNDGPVSHSQILAPDNQLNPLNLDVAGPGKAITIDAENLTAADQLLFVSIFGRTVVG